MISDPTESRAVIIACLSEPDPESFVLVTTNVSAIIDEVKDTITVLMKDKYLKTVHFFCMMISS